MTGKKRQLCGIKFVYPTWERAVHAALFASKQRGVALRAYDCAVCGGFHLTKHPGNPAVATVLGPFTPADMARLHPNAEEAQ